MSRQSYYKAPWLIWLVATLFLVFQFILQLSSGVLFEGLMDTFHIDALAVSFLTSAYYYIYVSLQLPVGLLLDRFDPRTILTSSAFICSLGCLCFALSPTYYWAILGRVTMGGGAAFAFCGLLLIIRQWFPKTAFSFMAGLSEGLSLIGTLIATVSIATLFSWVGWRGSYIIISLMGFGLTLLCFSIIPGTNSSLKKAPTNSSFSLWQQLKTVCLDPLAWSTGFYISIIFCLITVYAALWSTPFFMSKLKLNLTMASFLTGLLYLGTAIGCPLFGWLAEKLAKRLVLFFYSTCFSACFLLLILFLPSENILLYGMLQFCLGLSTGNYLLAFSVSDDIAPKGMVNTYSGFTNCLSVLLAPILQPIIGFLLDRQTAEQVVSFDAHHYQHALIILPMLLVLSLITLPLMPDVGEDRKNIRFRFTQLRERIF